MAAPNNSLDLHDVGFIFVREYYTFLHKKPFRLHAFYSDDSIFVRGDEGTDSVNVKGKEEIRKKIEACHFEDCKVLVTQVDSQGSADNGILVQVLGEMCNGNGPSQKFSQTFFLATQPNGYYILNDIFRFLKDEVEIDYYTCEEEIKPNHHPSVTETLVIDMPHVLDEEERRLDQLRLDQLKKEQEEKKRQEEEELKKQEEKKKQEEERIQQEEAAAAAAVKKQQEQLRKEQEAAAAKKLEENARKEEEQQQAAKKEEQAKKEKEAKALDHHNKKDDVVEEKKKPSKGDKGKKDQQRKEHKAAAAAAAAANAPTTTTTTATAPTSWAALTAAAPPPASPVAGTVTPTPTTGPSPLPAAATTVEVPVTEKAPQQQHQHKSQTQNAPRKETPHIFVKGVTEAISEEQLAEAFNKLGPVKSCNISRPRNCGFLEFEQLESAQKALAQNKVSVGSHTVYAEERRFNNGPNNRYNNNGRTQTYNDRRPTNNNNNRRANGPSRVNNNNNQPGKGRGTPTPK